MRVLLGHDEVPRRRLAVRWLWEPRDMWIGVFWNRAHGFLLVYVSIIPCLPVCIAYKLGAGEESGSSSPVAPDGSELHPTDGMPPDLVRVLRDQSIIVPQDQSR